MKKGPIKPVRCAIYTRVSTDHGLEQDFNSLDAQHDAAQAYIRSQTHAGWTLIRSRYADGGYSAGSTDRPALQRLLADVKAGKIDVIVVYKVDLPWKKTPMKRRREIIVPAVSSGDRRPIRAETRVTLVASIARGRRWLEEIIAGTVTGVEQIAARDKCSIRQVNMTISLAFLAPVLVKAAVEGRLPRGIGVTRLRDAPAEWSRQYAMLGLSI